MTGAEVRARLRELDARLAEASRRYTAAREAVRRARITHAADDLAEYYKQVRLDNPDPAEARRLTLHVLHRIERDGLVLIPIDPTRPNVGLRVADLRPREELAAAQRAAGLVQRQRVAFEAQHREALRREAEETQMVQLREALDGNDPSAVRAALSGLPDPKPGNPSAMTTGDLAS